MHKYEILAQIIVDSEIELIQSSDLPDDLHGIYVSCPGKKPIIAYRKSTTDCMACILAEEYAHHLFCAGDGTEDGHFAKKYEQRARGWAYRRLLPLRKLVDASNHGIRNRFELARYLEVPEDFLSDALLYYERKYGHSVKIGNASLFFNPLRVE